MWRRRPRSSETSSGHSSCSSSEVSSHRSLLQSDSGMDLSSIAEQVFEELSISENNLDSSDTEREHKLPHQPTGSDISLSLNFNVSSAEDESLFELYKQMVDWLDPQSNLFQTTPGKSHRYVQDHNYSVNTLDIPSLAIIAYLHSEEQQQLWGHLHEAKQFFTSRPWKFHHREWLAGKMQTHPHNNSHQYYTLTSDRPLCSVREIHTGSEHLRIMRYVTSKNWKDTVSFYKLILGQEPMTIKRDSCLFSVSHQGNFTVQFSLKKLPKGVLPKKTRKAELCFQVRDIGALVPLFPNVCHKVSDVRWCTKDLDGNKLYLEVPKPARRCRSVSPSKLYARTKHHQSHHSAFSPVVPNKLNRSNEISSKQSLLDKLSPRVYAKPPTGGGGCVDALRNRSPQKNIMINTNKYAQNSAFSKARTRTGGDLNLRVRPLSANSMPYENSCSHNAHECPTSSTPIKGVAKIRTRPSSANDILIVSSHDSPAEPVCSHSHTDSGFVDSSMDSIFNIGGRDPRRTPIIGTHLSNLTNYERFISTSNGEVALGHDGSEVVVAAQAAPFSPVSKDSGSSFTSYSDDNVFMLERKQQQQQQQQQQRSVSSNSNPYVCNHSQNNTGVQYSRVESFVEDQNKLLFTRQYESQDIINHSDVTSPNSKVSPSVGVVQGVQKDGRNVYNVGVQGVSNTTRQSNVLHGKPHPNVGVVQGVQQRRNGSVDSVDSVNSNKNVGNAFGGVALSQNTNNPPRQGKICSPALDTSNVTFRKLPHLESKDTYIPIFPQNINQNQSQSSNSDNQVNNNKTNTLPEKNELKLNLGEISNQENSIKEPQNLVRSNNNNNKGTCESDSNVNVNSTHTVSPFSELGDELTPRCPAVDADTHDLQEYMRITWGQNHREKGDSAKKDDGKIVASQDSLINKDISINSSNTDCQTKELQQQRQSQISNNAEVRQQKSEFTLSQFLNSNRKVSDYLERSSPPKLDDDEDDDDKDCDESTINHRPDLLQSNDCDNTNSSSLNNINSVIYNNGKDIYDTRDTREGGPEDIEIYKSLKSCLPGSVVKTRKRVSFSDINSKHEYEGLDWTIDVNGDEDVVEYQYDYEDDDDVMDNRAEEYDITNNFTNSDDLTSLNTNLNRVNTNNINIELRSTEDVNDTETSFMERQQTTNASVVNNLPNSTQNSSKVASIIAKFNTSPINTPVTTTNNIKVITNDNKPEYVSDRKSYPISSTITTTNYNTVIPNSPIPFTTITNSSTAIRNSPSPSNTTTNSSTAIPNYNHQYSTNYHNSSPVYNSHNSGNFNKLQHYNYEINNTNTRSSHPAPVECSDINNSTTNSSNKMEKTNNYSQDGVNNVGNPHNALYSPQEVDYSTHDWQKIKEKPQVGFYI